MPLKHDLTPRQQEKLANCALVVVVYFLIAGGACLAAIVWRIV